MSTSEKSESAPKTENKKGGANRIFISKLWASTGEKEIEAHFLDFTEVKIPTHNKKGNSKGYAFVQLAPGEDADRAVRMLDNSKIQGNQVRVALAGRQRNENSLLNKGYKKAHKSNRSRSGSPRRDPQRSSRSRSRRRHAPTAPAAITASAASSNPASSNPSSSTTGGAR